MSWYNTPIQPLDPVIQSQTPKPTIRYIRDNFNGTGMNSYVQAPAQDQSQWQLLRDIMPITRGVLNQRWGYSQFNVPVLGFTNRLFSFQSDSLGIRAIVITGSGSGAAALTETGTLYNTPIFVAESNGVIRSLTSRNYQYFVDGYNGLDNAHRTGDSLKWNGAASGGTTNIGILNTDVTVNSVGGGSSGNTAGPNTGNAASDIPYSTPNAWTNPAGILTNSYGSPAFNNLSETITVTNPFPGDFVTTYSNVLTTSDTLQVLNFFNSVSGSGVAGLQVALTYKCTFSPGGNVSPTSPCYVTVNIVKNGVLSGLSKRVPLTTDGASHVLQLGGPADLWGGSFAPADLVQANFGLQIQTSAPSFNLVNPDQVGTYTPFFNNKFAFVTITATLTGGAGTSSSSGTGVGVVAGVAGGSVNLTLGRTYYLVANTATIGHFSDLSVASSSTGAATNTEFNLVLATYNDPQVDTKFVLATPDGGDPSILYETQVVAGFQVTSWAINGSNVLTLTGTYPAGVAHYPNGTVLTLGGFVHGSYLNGNTITVSGGSGTTVVGPFTHGADSATERGVVGTPTFAIPNSCTFVVDNTPDPNLVLNQPLVYTDQFGNEFGLALNSPPMAGNLLIKHQGRLWMAGVQGATHSVYFSKAIPELTLPNGFVAGKYEEAWPGSNYFDVSDGAENVTGFLSDGQTLYIGTESHIRRLIGNAPSNFQEPQIVHPQVGLINQEVWQLVYMQGAPSGAIWMTPDFRVMQSDFNTYVDIGNPIQDFLNALQPSAQQLAHAAFVADGEFNLYILAVPYLQSTFCDLHLVFDLKSRQWFFWQPASGSVALLFNITQAGIPQWLFLNGTDSAINIYKSTATTDNGTPINATAGTTWLHLGEPTRRKVLNEIQVYGNTGMNVSIYGANNAADFTFALPRPIVYNRTLKQSPFGTWNLYLTGDKTKYRYYAIYFSATNGQTELLGSYAISSTPLDDL